MIGWRKRWEWQKRQFRHRTKKGNTMGTKNNPGKFDCYANAAPDEPMFILLGRDPCAPVTVLFWAHLRHVLYGLNVVGEAEKVKEATQLAFDMGNWATGLSPAKTKILSEATVIYAELWMTHNNRLEQIAEAIESSPHGVSAADVVRGFKKEGM